MNWGIKGEGWQMTYIPEYIPLLQTVGFGGQPGYYKCKWEHDVVNGKEIPIRFMVKKANQPDTPEGEYPHILIDLSPVNGVIIDFHYSPSKKGQRFGLNEVMDLLPILMEKMGEISVDDLISILYS
ncbi:MAG: hypothetical protein EAZ28_03845 [Oscillatoriales cyanobacterium]|nr:MAG: hypothetical protein EAZ28_03845 [Oscillatoriales cyanobacterium]